MRIFATLAVVIILGFYFATAGFLYYQNNELKKEISNQDEKNKMIESQFENCQQNTENLIGILKNLNISANPNEIESQKYIIENFVLNINNSQLNEAWKKFKEENTPENLKNFINVLLEISQK